MFIFSITSVEGSNHERARFNPGFCSWIRAVRNRVFGRGDEVMDLNRTEVSSRLGRFRRYYWVNVSK